MPTMVVCPSLLAQEFVVPRGKSTLSWDGVCGGDPHPVKALCALPWKNLN